MKIQVPIPIKTPYYFGEIYISLSCSSNLIMYIFFSQYDFEGRKDLVKFIKAVQNEGLYVILRVGPYIGGEWNFGCGDLLDFLLLSLVLFISLFIFFSCSSKNDIVIILQRLSCLAAFYSRNRVED